MSLPLSLDKKYLEELYLAATSKGTDGVKEWLENNFSKFGITPDNLGVVPLRNVTKPMPPVPKGATRWFISVSNRQCAFYKFQFVDVKYYIDILIPEEEKYDPMAAERTKFEKAFSSSWTNLERNEEGGYKDLHLNTLWKGWQACLQENKVPYRRI